jgi:hypothetical protein
MAKIILITSRIGTSVYKIDLIEKVTIGRSETCNYPIEDKALSKIHGYLEITKAGKVLYTDNDSSNGSKLHDKKIKKAEIQINDKVKIGSHYISIDPSNLTSAERVNIGQSTYVQSEVKLSAHTQTYTILRNEANKKT